jgi:hypothetical protein
MPSLGSYMCEQFVDGLLHFHTLACKGHDLQKPADSLYSLPVQLLVHTSLLTNGHNIASFPEFVCHLKGGTKVRKTWAKGFVLSWM